MRAVLSRFMEYAMKLSNQKLLLLMTVIGMTLSGMVQASLVDRGGGMIYDYVLNVTWLQDANYAKTSGHDADGRMNFVAANAWAADLSFGGYNDWRLPTLSPVNGTSFEHSFKYDGSTDRGYNITSPNSELAYMFYQNLGLLAQFDTSGIEQIGSSGSDWGVTNAGLFDNLQNFLYWTDIELATNTDKAWAFYNDTGYQNDLKKISNYFSWAVRDGDVSAVPVPAAVWLFGSALIGLVGLRRKW